MSNDIIAVTTGQLPAFLQEMGGYTDSGLSAGVAPKAPKVGITMAKQFTITRDGQTMQLPPAVRQDGNGNNIAVHVFRCVIVAASSTLTKAWYEKAYQPGQTEAPDCFSNDAKTPAPGVAKPQCTNCANCRKNAFGSGQNGRGKACADRKMLVVVWENEPKTLMGLNVPTMSLNNLRRIETELKDHNLPLQSVMMELSFDQAVLYPVIKISAVGFVDRETALRLRDAAESDEVAMMLREADYDLPEEAPQAEPPVPNQTVVLGGEAQVVDLGAAQQTQQAPQEAAEKPKRTRRTKAQIEADNAAAAAEAARQEAPAPKTERVLVYTDAAEGDTLEDFQRDDPAWTADLMVQEGYAVWQEVVVEEPQKKRRAAPAGGSQPAQTVELQADPRVAAAETQATTEPNLFAQETVAANRAPVAEQPVTQTVTTAAAAGGPNVADLLNKWRTGQ